MKSEEVGRVHVSFTFSLENLCFKTILLNYSAFESLCISKSNGVANPSEPC